MSFPMYIEESSQSSSSRSTPSHNNLANSTSNASNKPWSLSDDEDEDSDIELNSINDTIHTHDKNCGLVSLLQRDKDTIQSLIESHNQLMNRINQIRGKLLSTLQKQTLKQEKILLPLLQSEDNNTLSIINHSETEWNNKIKQKLCDIQAMQPDQIGYEQYLNKLIATLQAKYEDDEERLYPSLNNYALNSKNSPLAKKIQTSAQDYEQFEKNNSLSKSQEISKNSHPKNKHTRRNSQDNLVNRIAHFMFSPLTSKRALINGNSKPGTYDHTFDFQHAKQ